MEKRKSKNDISSDIKENNDNKNLLMKNNQINDSMKQKMTKKDENIKNLINEFKTEDIKNNGRRT